MHKFPAIFLSAVLLITTSSIAQAGKILALTTPPVLDGCPIFPTDNIWNVAIDTLPVHPRSDAFVQNIGLAGHLHPDFGSGTWDGWPIGIPYNIVSGTQPKVAIDFDYEDESDPGPYPIPPNPKIEGNPNCCDRHILILERDNCILYEIYNARHDSQGWHGGSGAIFHLRENGLRPAGWTSADAAGLPILPGLVRYDEVATGEIAHALRFTVSETNSSYVWPARHEASSLSGLQYPPMGQRFRMKANYDITRFSADTQVILRALKKYGMIIADNGSDWYISGSPDPRWDNDSLVSEFHSIPGSAFEAVDASSLMVLPDSAQTTSLPPRLWLAIIFH